MLGGRELRNHASCDPDVSEALPVGMEVRLTCPHLSISTIFMSQGAPKSSPSSFLMVIADSLCLLSVLLSVLQHVNSDT